MEDFITLKLFILVVFILWFYTFFVSLYLAFQLDKINKILKGRKNE